MHSQMRPRGLTQADIEKIANFDWDDSKDQENDEEDQEGAVNFEIIIEETLQSLIDGGENVEAGIIQEMIRKSGDENGNDEDIIQEALEKIVLQSLAWYYIRHCFRLSVQYCRESKF